MKFLVVFVMCVVAAVQAGLFSEEQKAKIMQIHIECFKESGVEESVALKARKGEYTDDPKLKKQIFCFDKKAGFQNDAGELQVDVIRAKLMEVIKDSQKTDALIQKCVKQGNSAEETAFSVAKCLHEAAPNKDIFA